MKPCEKILLYAQHDLPADEQQAMQAHIQTCAACQKQLAFLNRVEEAFVPPAAPSDLVDKVFAKTTRKKSFFARFKMALVSAATVAVLAVIVVANWQSAPQTTSGFDAQEVVAYLTANPDEEYELFASDLAAMEEDF